MARYRAKCSEPTRAGCLLWTSSISGRGHGRFWVGDGLVIIAHRFGWGLVHGVAALEATALLAHEVCDNPLCQNP